MEIMDTDDAYAVWQQYLGADFTPADALQEAHERELTIHEITAEIIEESIAGPWLGNREYARVYDAVYAQIEDAFEQQAPSL